MLDLTVPNMTCGACEKRIRKALETIAGIEAVSIDLPAHKVGITGGAAPAGIIQALSKAGYPPLGA